KRVLCVRPCGDLCGSVVHPTARWARLCAAAGEPTRLPRHNRFSRDRGDTVCDRGRQKGLPHTHGGWAAGCRHSRVRRIGAGSYASARGVSRARPVASVSAGTSSARLVILDGPPSLPPRLFADHGAKSPSWPMAQFWPRASRAYDVGNQWGYPCTRDLRRTVKHQLGAIVLRALRTQVTPTSMRSGNSGSLHDLTPTLYFRADERLKGLGRLTDDGQHANIGELLFDLRHRHDNLQLGMEPVHDVLGRAGRRENDRPVRLIETGN